MPSMPLPITTVTAAVMGLFCVVLAFRVGQGRMRHGVSLGDGGQTEMTVRVRTHANFVEYVPLILVLMALLELGGADRTFLMAFGAALVLVRLLHAVGMPRKAPNPFRAGGALGTWVLLVVAAVYALRLALPAL